MSRRSFPFHFISRAIPLMVLVLFSTANSHGSDKEVIFFITGTNFWNDPLIWTPLGAPAEPAAGDNVTVGSGMEGGNFLSNTRALFYVTTRPDNTVLGTLKINAELRNHGVPFAPDFTGFSPFDYSARHSRGIVQTAQSLRTTFEIIGDNEAGFFFQSGGLHAVLTDVILGKQAGANGLYLLNGPIDNLFHVNQDLIIGDAGEGYYQQILGGLQVGRNMVVGREAGGFGKGLIGGAVEIAGSLHVGHSGTGELSIGLTTGQVSVTEKVVLGTNTTGQGTLHSLTLSSLDTNQFIVGDAGAGTVWGAGVIMVHGDMIAGRLAGSHGTVYPLETGAFVLDRDLVLGDAGEANLTMAMGHVDIARNFVVGRTASGSGTGLMGGLGALEVGNDAIIGAAGDGNLIMGGGGWTVGQKMIIGQTASGRGEVELLASSSTSVGSDVIVGDAGEGWLKVGLSGSLQVDRDVLVGNALGAQGYLGVGQLSTGYGGVLDIEGNLHVGVRGQGEFWSETGSIEVTGDLSIGHDASGEGLATLGLSATMDAGRIFVGTDGLGELNLTGHTILRSYGQFVVGAATGAGGTVSLSDEARLVVAGNAAIGRGGLGSIELDGTADDSLFNLDFQHALSVGTAGGTGSVTVQAGRLGVAGGVDIGALGTGHWLQQGGTAEFAETVRVGHATSGTGEFAQTGGLVTATRWEMNTGGSALLTGGYFSVGQLEQSGGSFTLGDGRIFLVGASGTHHARAQDVTLSGGLMTLPTLVIDGGTFTQTGGQLVTGQLVYISGTLAGVITSSGSFELGPLAAAFTGQLVSEGAFSLDQFFAPGDGLVSRGATTIAAGGELAGGPLTVEAGALTVEDDGEVNLPDIGEVSSGSLTLMGGSRFQVSAFNQSGGTTEVRNGAQFLVTNTLTLTGGNFTARTGATVNANAFAINGGFFTLEPFVTTNLAAKTLTIGAAGTAALHAPAALALPATTLVRGTLTGTGNWQLATGKTFTLDRGSLTGTGAVTVANGAQIDVVASGATLARDIVNQGTMRVNVADVPYSQLFGGGTLTNEAGGTVRFMDAPHAGTSYNPNGIFAPGLNVVNAGTLTLGALTTQTLDQAYTLFYTGGAFSNSGAVTLTNHSQLRLMGGGSSTGTFDLGSAVYDANGTGAHILFAGGHTVTDSGSTFTGQGYAHFAGGTLLTGGGNYTPNYNLSFDGLVGGPTPLLPGVTGLTIARNLWIQGRAPDAPITLLAGSKLNWVAGEHNGTVTVGHDAVLNFSGPAFNIFNLTGIDTVQNGDIGNHGTIRAGGDATGTGRLLNFSDGVVTTRGENDIPGQLIRFTKEIVNEGLLELELRENGLLEFGTITNAGGQVVFRATETSADMQDDLVLRVGDYTQTSGSTVIDLKQWGFGSFPDPYLEAGVFRVLGGTVNATGTLRVSSLLNQGTFSVGSSGLTLAGNLTNQAGGVLSLNGLLTQTSGSFTLDSGSRVILAGPNANVSRSSGPMFSGDFTTPAGVTVEVRNGQDFDGNGSLVTNGTLILGSGSSLSRWGGTLGGSGEIRIDSGGTMALGGNGNWSNGPLITIATGGTLDLYAHDNGINRFYGTTLVNNGTVMHTGAHVGMSAPTTITNNGTWTSQVGGPVGYFTGDSQTGGGQFINNGTFVKNGIYETGFGGGVSFHNFGTVNLNAGSFVLYSGGTFAGSSVVNMAGGTNFVMRESVFTINSGAHFNGGTLGLGVGGTTTLNGDVHATNAVFWGGTLNGSHTLHGTWDMGYGANFSTAGTTTIATDGIWNFVGHDNGINRLYGRSFVNDGTVNHNSSHVGVSGSTTITNNATWNERANGPVSYYAADGQAGGGQFINNGNFVKTGVYEAAFSGGVNFQNNGVIDVQGGSVAFYSTATLAGSSVVNMAAGTSVLMRDGIFTVNSGAHFNGGTLSLGFGGTTTLNGDVYATNAVFWGGTLNGSHTLHGAWDMGYGANFSTAGTTTIAADGIWNFVGHDNGINRLYGRMLVNNGIVNHNSSHVGVSGSTTITNNATWNERANGPVSYYAADGQAGGGQFINNGTFVKTGVYEAAFSGGVNFQNNGVIDIQGGSVAFYSTATLAGSSVVNMAAGTSVLMRDGTFTVNSGAHFNGGTLSLGSGGTTTLNGDVYATNATFWGGTLNGSHTLHGTWDMGYVANLSTAGTTTIAADGIWNFVGHDNGINRLYGRAFVNNGVVNHDSSHVGVSGATTITNNATWNERTNGPVAFYPGDGQAGGGQFINNGSFVKTGIYEVAFSGVNFRNNGTVELVNGPLRFYGAGALANRNGNALEGGAWVLRSGTYIRDDSGVTLTTNRADLTFHGSAYYWDSAFTRNEGTLRFLSGNAFSTTTAFTNTGTMQVGAGSAFNSSATFANSGTLNIDGAFSSAGLTNTGTLGGSGTFTGSLISAGTLSPGNSPGLLTVTGDLTLQSTSALLMELGGTSEGVSYDSIDVSGLLTFGGNLNVTLVNAFAPASGATFNLFDANGFSGTFAAVNLPTLTTGLTWNTSGLYSAGTLSVTGIAIPEPSTYAALAGVAALGLALWRRRTVFS